MEKMKANKVKVFLIGVMVLLLMFALIGCAPAAPAEEQVAVDEKPADVPAEPEKIEEEPYPSKTITIIVPSGPGGMLDLTARSVSAMGQDIFGVPVVVRNEPGGDMMIGANEMLAADPDGYTLLISESHIFSHGPKFYGEENVTLDNIRMIGNLMMGHNGFMVHAVDGVSPRGWETLDDLIEYGRENPGEVTMGTFSINGELMLLSLLEELGFNAISVPTAGGGDAAAQVAGGHIDGYIGSIGGAAGLYAAGHLDILAVIGEPDPVPAAAAGLPRLHEDYPHVAEAIGPIGIGVAGIVVNKDVPQDRVAILEELIYNVSENPTFLTMLTRIGGTPFYMDSEEWSGRAQEEYDIMMRLSEKYDL